MKLTHPIPADPTAIDTGGDLDLSDPRVRRLDGWTAHRSLRINMPFMTQVAENLWHGGVAPGLVLPEFVEYKLSLYQWEDYEIRHELKDSLSVEMYDSLDQGFDLVYDLAEWVNQRRADGPVFVHCQAGLNRSSLVVAMSLVTSGEAANGAEAIDIIRAKRDAACLCNPAFEAWVRRQPMEDVDG